jgi:hypothetical protein
MGPNAWPKEMEASPWIRPRLESETLAGGPELVRDLLKIYCQLLRECYIFIIQTRQPAPNYVEPE